MTKLVYIIIWDRKEDQNYSYKSVDMQCNQLLKLIQNCHLDLKYYDLCFQYTLLVFLYISRLYIPSKTANGLPIKKKGIEKNQSTIARNSSPYIAIAVYCTEPVFFCKILLVQEQTKVIGWPSHVPLLIPSSSKEFCFFSS